MDKLELIDFSKYTITKDGKIWSNSKNKHRYLKGNADSDGYYRVTLTNTDGTRKSFQWNRVIWYYFNGEIPEGIQVNHIDENKANNALSNLNLLTPGENINWGTRNERVAKTLSEKLKGKNMGKDNPNWGNKWTDEQKKHLSDLKKAKGLKNEKSPLAKKVLQYTLDGEFVKEWPSTMECKRCGFNQGSIAECCRGGRWRDGKWIKCETYKGYIWKYK